MTDLENSSFYNLLPPNLRDVSARAFSYATDRQFAKLYGYILKTYIYAMIMEIDEPLCDFLALQHDIKAYDIAFPLQTKREMISIAFMINLKKGTASAVRNVIGTIHGGADIEEWFEYGGEPHYFKVNIDSTKQGVDVDDYDKLIENIDEYKALRSHLEGITVNLKSAMNQAIGAAVVSGEYAILTPAIHEEIISGTTGIGGVVVSGEVAVIVPLMPRVEATMQAAVAGACVSGEAATIRPHIQSSLRVSAAMVPAGAVVSGEHSIIKMSRLED